MPSATAAASPAPLALRPETLRGAPGFFRVGQDAGGQWWLLDADDRPFFARAVHGVRAAPAEGEGTLPRDSAARLRAWGFNAAGAGGDGAGWADGFAFLATVDFCGAAPVLPGPGLRLPDVF